jgi:hypothetical protein
LQSSSVNNGSDSASLVQTDSSSGLDTFGDDDNENDNNTDPSSTLIQATN